MDPRDERSEKSVWSCCASLETAIGKASGFSLLADDNSQKTQVIMSVIGNKEDSISCSSLNVLFNG